MSGLQHVLCALVFFTAAAHDSIVPAKALMRLNACMPEHFRCTSTRECIRSGQHCDGIRDCADGSDEDNCRASCSYKEWECASGQCIDASQKCNGVRDCDDGTDEDGCPPPPGSETVDKASVLIQINQEIANTDDELKACELKKQLLQIKRARLDVELRYWL